MEGRSIFNKAVKISTAQGGLSLYCVMNYYIKTKFKTVVNIILLVLS